MLLDEMIEMGVPNPRSHKKYLKLLEDIKVIQKVADNYSTMQEVSDILDRIFSDKESGIKLMTMHKAKGLENDKVFIVRMDLIPSKYAKTDEQLQQEKNLLYVAFTRAQNELVIDKKWKE